MEQHCSDWTFVSRASRRLSVFVGVQPHFQAAMSSVDALLGPRRAMNISRLLSDNPNQHLCDTTPYNVIRIPMDEVRGLKATLTGERDEDPESPPPDQEPPDEGGAYRQV